MRLQPRTNLLERRRPFELERHAPHVTVGRVNDELLHAHRHHFAPRDGGELKARVIEAFGPARTMFATNWPVMEIGGKYGAWPSAFAAICAEIGCVPGDIETMFGATARRVYGI